MINILLIISLLYYILIIWLIIGFDRIKTFRPTKIEEKNNFSIIVPFRNEASNLPELIKSINNIHYDASKFEILFIDDASTDNSVSIINEYISNKVKFSIYKNIRQSKSPKKDAITTALKYVKKEWILTTDADCIVNKLWLKTYNSFIEDTQKTVFIAAPVKYHTGKNFIEKFQKIDFASLIGTTIGSFGNNKPIMCNGANLCYTKKAFKKVNGFTGNNNIASGDDVFLMEKMIKKYPNKVHYLKSVDATVITKPEINLKNLIEQRIRWASKTGNSKNAYTLIIGLIVFVYNFSLAISLLWRIFKINKMYVIALFFILKISLDYILINKTLKLFKEHLNKKQYFLSAIIHPYFISIISILSLFKKYKWKNRSYYK